MRLLYSFVLRFFILQGKCPTVCVTGAGAGVDSIREQEKTRSEENA
jgi:hypothetical protein